MYYTRAVRNFRPFFDFIPCHKNADGSDKIPTETKSIVVTKQKSCDILGALNSSLTFEIFCWYTDVRNINPGIIKELRIPAIEDSSNIRKLVNSLIRDFKRNKETRFNRTNNCTESYYFPVKSKSIIDEIDILLARHYGFTDEELDFIINYETKYRMGDELNNSEE